jgi:hypothetical protein
LCNPDKRLTAAAALKLPRLAEEGALETLPKKREAASALPKGELQIDDAAGSGKKRKLLCA